MADADPAVSDAVLVLRVVGGRLEGAEEILRAGQTLRIGHAFDNDVVLRGRDTKGVALRLTLAERGARIEVREGSATLLGLPLAAGASALLPLYVPLLIGEFAVALGSPGTARWDEVLPLASSAAISPDADDAADTAQSPVAQLPAWLAKEGHALGGRVAKFGRPWMMVGISVVLLGVVAAQPAKRFVVDQLNTPRSVEANLVAAGFQGLSVRRDEATGQLRVEGRVPDDPTADALRRFVDARYDRSAVSVVTMTAVASAVTELLKAQGVDAEAKVGRSGLVVHSEFLPGDRIALLQAKIRGDVPDAGPVQFVRDAARGPRDLQYFFASKRFGLASLVDGDPGHIVTQDGQYWFAGAILPTGHRLVSVGHGSVTFERDGLSETLQIAPAGVSSVAPDMRATTSLSPVSINPAGQGEPAPRSRT